MPNADHQFRTQPASSKLLSKAEERRRLCSVSGLSLCEMPCAMQSVRALLGCYRKGDAEDPTTYVTAIATMLTEYPEVVVKAATDPRTGVQRACKFLPTFFEVRQACEDQMRPITDRFREEQRRAAEETFDHPPEHRARMTELFSGLLADWAARCEGEGKAADHRDARRMPVGVDRDGIEALHLAEVQAKALASAASPIRFSPLALRALADRELIRAEQGVRS